MKNFSKICINSSIFISSSIMTLLILNENANATPNPLFYKPSTIQLLSKAVKNPSESFIQRLSNGNLRASFLHSGRRGHLLSSFNIRSSSTVFVKKTLNSDYFPLLPTRNNKTIISDANEFKIHTISKNGFNKIITIFQENGKIIVNSKKGEGTPNYIFKSTTLDFGDSASTSSQASLSSNQPLITSTRYSNYDQNTKNFNVEEKIIYNPLNSKIISKTITDKITGKISTLLDKTIDDTPSGKYDPKNFRKPSTARLLSEIIMNPDNASITKTPDEKLKIKFLYWNSPSDTCNNLTIRVKSTIKVKKTPDSNFEEVNKPKGKRQITDEGFAFNILSYNKNGLNKEINITTQNGNIIVDSVKGAGTPLQVIKRTMLDYGDGSSSPKIIVTRSSFSSEQVTEFDVKKVATYDATNFKLLSQTIKNESTGEAEHITKNPDDTKTRIVTHASGKIEKFIMTHFDDNIYSELIDNDGNTLITKQLNNEVLSFRKLSPDGKLIEESLSSPTQYESRTYNENGFITSSTRSNTLPSGESLGTITYADGSSITQERRSNGSLISSITRTTNGELIKQDFDENSQPINQPYKIN